MNFTGYISNFNSFVIISKLLIHAYLFYYCAIVKNKKESQGSW